MEEAQKPRCPRCESVRWMIGVKPFDGISLCAVPGTWREGPKGFTTTTISTCADCRYVELSLDDPENLWAAWSAEKR